MRNGKIARLPEGVRNELNPRMERGESCATILEWLNGLAVVQTLLKEEFDGTPISKQNLYEWRQGGFREWEMKEEVFSAAAGLKGMNGKIDVPALIGDLLATIAARYACLMLRWDGERDPEFEAKERVLGRLLGNFVRIQRNVQPAETPKEKKKPSADDLGEFGGAEMVQQLQELMAGAGEKIEAGEAASEKNGSGGTLLRKDPRSQERPGGHADKVDKQVTLPGTRLREDATARQARLQDDASARQARNSAEPRQPNVVELKGLGLAGSGLVKPGQTGSNQKIDFGAGEARVYAGRIS